MRLRAIAHDDAELVAALRQSQLPTDDLQGQARIYAFDEPTGPAAFGGLGGVGPDQFIRSVVVPDGNRGQGHGRHIVEALSDQARADGAERVWLLTTTAEPFFASLGWTAVDRGQAPDAVRSSRQFSELCPSSAVLMCRRLA